MTKLSPAAQAVFDSYKTASDGCYSGGEWLQNEAGQIAAALRAAVTAVGSEEMFHPESKRTEGVKWCVQRIYAIADELEAQ